MKRLIQIVGFGLLLLSFGIVMVACDAGTDGDQTVFGGSRIVHEDESIDGNLTIFGGDVVIEEDAKVDGDLSVFGGSVEIKREAKIDGNLTVLGGNVTLEADAEIDGDLINLGGNVTRSQKSVIKGDVLPVGGTEKRLDEPTASTSAETNDRSDDRDEVAETEEKSDFEFKAERRARGESSRFMGGIFGVIASIVSLFLKTVAFGVLGLVLSIFLPEHVRRVGQAAEKAPAASAAVGCLSLPALVVLTLIAAITIIGIPVAILLPFLAGAAGIFGWIGVGLFLGDRLLRTIEIRSPRPAAAAAIGAGGLVLVAAFADVIPFVGWFVGPFIWMWGLGATILTRGGRQPYPARSGFNFNFNDPVPPPPFDPLDELDYMTPASESSGDLFADLAADLGITDILGDDDDDDKPNRPEKPAPPTKQ